MIEENAKIKNLALVSIIVPTFNSSRTLERCLSSIELQGYPNIELIVVDNSSTDGTPEIAARFTRTVIAGDGERCRQRNMGMLASSGDYVLFIDSDMILLPNVVEECVAAARRGAKAVAIPEKSFGSGYWSACKAFERSFYRHDSIVSAPRFFQKADAMDVGGYDERLVGGEDWDIGMRILVGGKLQFASSEILHDEGRIQILALIAKKFYYGKTLIRYLHKHGGAGLRKMSPFRRSLIVGIPTILQKPHLGAGMVFLKACEMVAVAFGMAVGYGDGNRCGRVKP